MTEFVTFLEIIQSADWGEDVVRNTYPSKSLIDKGVVCAYGSDFFVSPSYGIAGIQVAMTRSSDIETVPVENIQDIQVLETVFKGKTVFKKK